MKVKKKRLKENPRMMAVSFRTTEDVLKEVERISQETNRTKSLQCEYFVKEGIKAYRKQEDET
jgi:predicted transcriptional regulator